MDLLIQKREVERLAAIEKRIDDDATSMLGVSDSHELGMLSLEEEKKILVEKCYTCFRDKKREQLRALLSDFRAKNKLCLELVEREMSRMRMEDKVWRGELNLIRKDITDDEKANTIIEGLAALLGNEQEELRRYIGLGVDGLAAIRQSLSDMEEEDLRETETIALGLEVLRKLERTLHEEDAVGRSMLGELHRGGVGRLICAVLKREEGPSEQSVLQLAGLVKTELEEHNAVLKELGFQNSLITESHEQMRRVQHLSEKQLQISGDLSLCLNRFIMPSVVFPSGAYASYTCKDSEAARIVGRGQIDGGNILPVNRRRLQLAYQSEYAGFMPYVVNDVKATGRYCFVFPLEAVLTGRFFCWDGTLSGTVRVFARPGDEQLNARIDDRDRDFDAIIKNIENTYQMWIAEAQKINNRFKSNWTDSARRVIEKDFSKRWMREVAPELTAGGNVGCTILTTIFEQEDLLRMSRGQLVGAVDKSRAFYLKMVSGVKAFLDGADVTQDIGSGIFFAPVSEVLFWEHRFLGAGKRPGVVYYEGELRTAVLSRLGECMANKYFTKPPRPNDVEVYEFESDMPLRTL